jgi:hypothetical protein
MQCKGRYTKEKKEIPFPTKSGYFTERRCGEIAAHDELCEGCIEKRKLTIVKDGLNYTPKNQQSQYLGKVDEPYYENCWLFGSPRYLKFAGLDGNALSGVDLTKAETAQRIARGNLEMKAKAPKAEVKKLGSTKKNGTVVSTPAEPATATPTPPPVSTPAPLVVEQKPKPMPKPKKVVKKNAPVAVVQVAKAVEVAEEPLEAIEVIKIQLVPKVIADKSYWLDSSKDKVYEKTKDGAIGKYLGRYDSREQTLVSFPDSDVE